jgi:putative DNA methylase
LNSNDKRLIEVAFPLKQASLDSVHEKNVRHGHISTLHIWPARRPLAACRAALVATLLPDPANDAEREIIMQKLAGRVVNVVKKKKLPNGAIEELVVPETVGGILHWGRESSADLAWFRKRIRDAWPEHSPRVLDPFGGGGAIPLEAMRLGCSATALDINPVAWLLLKCTVEYPHAFAGYQQPLPKFALDAPDFMEQFFKETSKLTKKQLERNLKAVQERLFPQPEVDLPWHIRAWGHWVLERAKVSLDPLYPEIDGSPTAAYLWARSAKCKSCRAIIPLLKTRWLCKKDDKRVLLTMEPNSARDGVTLGVQGNVPRPIGNAAQRREHDKRIAAGTVRGKGPSLVVVCPCCGQVSLTSDDLRRESKAGRLGLLMTAVVLEGGHGKEYQTVSEAQRNAAESAEAMLATVYSEVPFGLPRESTPDAAGTKRNSSSLRLYGLNEWKDLFTPRQLLALGTLVNRTREAVVELHKHGYPPGWAEAIGAYLGLAVDRVANRCSCNCVWNMPAEKIEQTFARFALPVLWDFAESNPIANCSGNYLGEIEWISLVCKHTQKAAEGSETPSVRLGSATQGTTGQFDVIMTDPPYYDAIMYSDIMDFFYVWLRRTTHGLSENIDQIFREPLGPKWNHETRDGELIDDPSRHNADFKASLAAYEDGMFRAFKSCYSSLVESGRMVVVFANKQPEAWESLVGAIIRAGFVVDGSWPIQTERTGRIRATGSSALASSVWLVCKKRQDLTRPAWDNLVMGEMRERIQDRLREFWDAGIRGPDFVWAATGPALEVYSRHPVVKKANKPGEVMNVSEFLGHVRRIVVDFIVGQVLTGSGQVESTSGLDDVTTYYILHRYDFGFTEAPIGACILYAVSCGLTDRELTDRYEILVKSGGSFTTDQDDEVESEGEDAAESDEDAGSSGSKVKLRPWAQRQRKNLGVDVNGKPAPLIDQVHRLMHLWKAGDAARVDEYVDSRALRRSVIFIQLIQALIELSPTGSDERAILESLSNYVTARGVAYEDRQLPLGS